MDLCRLACMALLVALSLAGCGTSASGPQRHAVSGNVTFQGKPVPRGRIEFEPDASRGNRGPVGIAEIVDGRYATNRRFGSVSGPLIVRIDGNDGMPRPNPEGWTDPNGSPLFTGHVETIDLPAGTATWDFQIARE